MPHFPLTDDNCAIPMSNEAGLEGSLLCLGSSLSAGISAEPSYHSPWRSHCRLNCNTSMETQRGIIYTFKMQNPGKVAVKQIQELYQWSVYCKLAKLPRVILGQSPTCIQSSMSAIVFISTLAGLFNANPLYFTALNLHFRNLDELKRRNIQTPWFRHPKPSERNRILFQ